MNAARILLTLALAGIPCAAIVLPDAIRGVSYEASLTLPQGSRCPMSDSFWRIAGGDIPQGLTADVNGLRGNPRQLGEFRFVLEAVNNCGKTVFPVQLRVRPRPLLVVSAESVQVEVFAGSAPVTRRILVSSDWAELPFSIHADGAPWLSAVPEAMVTPTADSALSAIPVDIQMRPQELQPGVYRAKVRVSAWSAANPSAVEVTMIVKAAP